MRLLTTADLAAARALHHRDEFFWLNLEDPSAETIDAVGELLGWHPLAREDSREFGQRPKLDPYGEHALLVYYGASTDARGLPCAVEVHLYVAQRFVVTVHRGTCEPIVKAQARASDATADDVVYRILDALTDTVLDVLDAAADDVDAFQAEVVRRPRAGRRDQMADLRLALGRLRRTLAIQQHVLPGAVERIGALTGHHGRAAYYRDLADHAARAVDEADAAGDAVLAALDDYTNEVQERLTIVATIFLPLTVVTGFFGQNFGWLVHHLDGPAAFVGWGLGGLVVSCALIVAWLHRSGLTTWRRS